jgi:hypothetical protein
MTSNLDQELDDMTPGSRINLNRSPVQGSTCSRQISGVSQDLDDDDSESDPMPQGPQVDDEYIKMIVRNMMDEQEEE